MVNELNTLFKEKDYQNYKAKPNHMLSIIYAFKMQRYRWSESKIMEKLYWASHKHKKADTAKLISNKINFKNRILQDIKGHIK